MQCSYNYCKSEVSFLCYCNSTQTFFCESHKSIHESHTDPNSSVLNILVSLSQNQKIRAIQEVSATLKYLKDFQNTIQKDTKSLISQIMLESKKVLKIIWNYENNYSKLLKKIQSDSQVNLFYLEHCQSLHSDIQTSILEISNHLRFHYKNQEDLMKSNFYSNSMSFIDFEYENIRTIENVRRGFFELKNSVNCAALDSQSGICELPGNKTFFYGGGNNTWSKAVFIFDKTTGKLIRKNDHKTIAYVGCCCYYKGNVFVFGGMTGVFNYTKDAQKYCLFSDSWTKVCPLPTGFSSVSCVRLFDSILLTGYKASCLYEFCIECNNYRSFGEFKKKSYKIVIRGWQSIFVIENRKLHEFVSLNGDVIKTDTIVSKRPLLSYCIKNGTMIYFILDNKEIYKFNLLNREIKLITKFSL